MEIDPNSIEAQRARVQAKLARVQAKLGEIELYESTKGERTEQARQRLGSIIRNYVEWAEMLGITDYEEVGLYYEESSRDSNLGWGKDPVSLLLNTIFPYRN